MPFAVNAMRRVYAHAAVQAFVEASGGIFIVGFLASRGLSYPAALASFAAILLSRFAMRGAVLPLARRQGLKAVVLAGIAVRAAGFLMLPFVTDVGPMLALFVIVTGFGSVLYWTGWHAFASALGDSATGGRQVSIQQATTAVVGIAAPVVGGFLLARAGALTGFAAIAWIQAMGALPLLRAPNPRVAEGVVLDRALTRFARRLYFAEGFGTGCAVVIWNLALFAALGERFEAFGGALALAGLAAAAGSLVIGRLIDGGHPLRSVALAYGAAALAIAVKAGVVAAGSPAALAIGATALGALVMPMTATAMLAPLYAMARHSNCTLRFNMVTEGGWDLGCSAACLAAAAALHAGAGFAVPILTGLVAVATIAALLRRWYRGGDQISEESTTGRLSRVPR
ncbi:MFS transporter [Novosphingobium sp. KCTC 2891]|uniref:MFS transporter n=1 Tax=Novosphingobium sp. KCTC 2891 TaxID=2989730 RepID=UPI0022218DB6|nr:MFS transporter [Novosphingobium sp. KCTC 2891]MCW1384000.1 MFS transporter [Novosphingobium sp. KCTC 2891]